MGKLPSLLCRGYKPAHGRGQVWRAVDLVQSNCVPSVEVYACDRLSEVGDGRIAGNDEHGHLIWRMGWPPAPAAQSTMQSRASQQGARAEPLPATRKLGRTRRTRAPCMAPARQAAAEEIPRVFLSGLVSINALTTTYAMARAFAT